MTILVEAEVILQSGESETRIVDLTISSPQDFIPKLLFEVRREFTDNVRLPPGSPRIYVLSERDKPIRIAPNASVEPLLKWNGIYFESGANLVQHKFRVCQKTRLNLKKGPFLTINLLKEAVFGQ